MRHPYHLVEPSPWPILISINLLFLLLSLIGYLNGYLYSLINIKITLITFLYISILWFFDIYTESLYMGFHSIKVTKGLILGFITFVLTEIMLFFSFFWAYFHSASHLMDLVWPPIGIDLVNPWGIPLLNTLLLLYSGVTATVSHHSFINRNKDMSIKYLIISILLGITFLFFQYFEYYYSSFDLTDSVFSSSFYILTFTHGLHVIIGVTLLFIVLLRLSIFNNPTLFFEISLLYYHFVDIVWIFLFILIYYLSY
jgi:cytochrome c oxidase subunit 3